MIRPPRSPSARALLVVALLVVLAASAVLVGPRDWLARPAAVDGDAPGAETAADCRARDDARTICVLRDDLLAYLAGRSSESPNEGVAARFEAASGAERRRWIDGFVRDEALAREARARGLDGPDEAARLALVARLEQELEAAGDGAASRVDDEQIAAAYQARAGEFRRPATVRFAHVYARLYEGLEPQSLQRARGILEELNRVHVPFDQGFPYGDPFDLDRVYDDRRVDDVRRDFGEEFARALEKLEPDPRVWRGPIRSKHGLHLVLLTAREPAREIPLERARDELRDGILRERREAALARALDEIVAKYRVEVEAGLDGLPPKSPAPR